MNKQVKNIYAIPHHVHSAIVLRVQHQNRIIARPSAKKQVNGPYAFDAPIRA